jgi:ammonium transporter, Amt family
MSASVAGVDVAWLLVLGGSSLIAGPALALFYGVYASRSDRGDAVRRALVALPLLVAQWLAVGQWIAGDREAGVVGAFRMLLAVLVPSVVAAGFAEAITLPAYVAFVLGWATFVYAPVARWVGGMDGGLGALTLDFAGGVRVHVTAGVAALVASRRLQARRERTTAASDGAPGLLPGTLGLGVVWLTASLASSIGRPEVTTPALAATLLGASGGALGGAFVEWREGRRAATRAAASGLMAGFAALAAGAGYVGPSAALAIGFIAGAVGQGTPLGFVSGSLAAVLAITAAAGYVAPATAIGIGGLAAVLCYLAVLVQSRVPSGRGRDAFAVHAVGGVVGAALTGVFAQRALNLSGGDGALFGDSGRLAVQVATCIAVAAYTGTGTWMLLRAIDATLGFHRRASEGALVDAVADSRSTLSSGVFQARGLHADALTVESLLEGAAEADAARAAKS